MGRMNPDKLNELRIKAEAKQRSRISPWLIILGVTILTLVALFYAWPRAKDNIRLVGGKETTPPAAGTSSGSTTGEKSVANNSPAPGSNSSPAPGPRSTGKTSDAVLTVSGYIINRERIALSPRFLGVVKWIGVKKGDAVTNGQVVVLLDDAEYRARLHEAEGRLESAKVAVSRAELDFKRASELVRGKVEMQKMEDDARLQLESARAAIKEVNGQIELIATYIQWTVIRSPIDGVVLEKLVNPNELVMPQSFGGTRGPSTELIAVADPKDLQVEIDLNEADVAKVFLNQKCRVSPEAYGEKTYEGYVAEMAPEANRQKGTLQIKVQVKNPDRFLTPELSAKVDFLSGPNKPE